MSDEQRSPVSAVPSVVPPPQWKTPIVSQGGIWTECQIVAVCGCRVWLDVESNGDEEKRGDCCAVHSFAALDSGLALLRGALEKEGKR